MNEGSHIKTGNFGVNFILGGLSGAIAKTAVTPFERMKFLLKFQTLEPNYPEDGYKGIIDFFVKVSKQKGVLEFWRGNLPNVIRYFPTQALNFAFKDSFKTFFCPYDYKTQFWKSLSGNLLSGGFSGGATLLILYPFDFTRTKLAFDISRSSYNRKFSSFSDCFIKTFKSEGIRGLYRSFMISVTSIFIYRALYFGGYDTTKEALTDGGKKMGFAKKFIVANIVTTFSNVASYPLETIRRRVMMDARRTESLYNGIFDCTRKIYEKEGWKTFFIGAIPNVSRLMGASLCLACYDQFQGILMKKV